jgi:diguanylate cyclase (GGDEF)-like protein
MPKRSRDYQSKQRILIQAGLVGLCAGLAAGLLAIIAEALLAAAAPGLFPKAIGEAMAGLRNELGQSLPVLALGWTLVLNLVLAIAIGFLAAALVLARKALHTLTLHDSLTGLPNRQLFADRYGQLISRADRFNERAVIFQFDLDGFKAINHRHGHQIGDRLLAEVAGRLDLTLRKTDTMARIGADEFVILAPLSQESALSAVHERIRSCFNEAFVFGQSKLMVSISLGHAIFPDDGRQLEQLLKTADDRMCRARKAKAG